MSIRDSAKKSVAFMELFHFYSNREETARKWKASGKKVVGQLGADVPEELIIASGMLPIKVYAGPERQLPAAGRYLEEAFDPISRAHFEKIVDGTYGGLMSSLVITNSADVCVRLFVYLREILRTDPAVSVPLIAFIDWLFSRNYLYQEHNAFTIGEFKKQLEAWSGRAIKDDDIHAASELCNDNRAALRDISALRKGDSVRISGSEALVICGSAFFMEKEQHTRLVRAVAQEARSWPEVKGRRLYLTGSAQETTELYELIEHAGGVVVGEDHDWGDRYYDNNTRTDIDPLRAIVDRYMLRVSNTKRASVTLRVADLTENAQKAKAEGVVFVANMNDDALTWEYPSQKKTLGEIGIKSAYFGRVQYSAPKTEQLCDGIRRFVESLKGSDGR